jgi:cytochrome P450
MTSADTTPETPDTAAPLCPLTGHGARPEVALNIHGAFFSRNNYAVYEDLRPRCPVVYSTEHGGFWLTLDYASTFDATRDDDLFTSTPGTNIPNDPETEKDAGVAQISPPIHTDPPLTGAMRKLTLPLLSPKRATDIEPQIRRIVTEQIDSFIEAGAADIVNQLSTPLPARIILRLLGFDEDRWPEWVSYVHGIIHDNHDDPEGLSRTAAMDKIAVAILAEMEQYFSKGSVEGYTDMTAAILGGQVLGRELTVEEKFGYLLLLLFGGMDTTSGLTGNTLVLLSRRPELRQQLIDHPEIMPTAVEEFLRLGTPTQGLARTISRDAEFHGQQLKEGDRALLLWAAANRDPAAFDDPLEPDLERTPNRHLAFGVGQHRCLGSNLARSMFRIMLEEILTRLPDFTMVDPEPKVFTDAFAVYAPRELKVRFTPGPRIGATR